MKTTPSLRGGGGLRFAWGASPFLGLTLQGDVGYGESVERTADDQFYVDLGGALDFDFSAIGRVPIGVVLGSKIDSFPESGSDVAHDVTTGLVRVAYNGRPEFVVAVDLTLEQYNSKALDQNVRFGSLGINLRYYF